MFIGRTSLFMKIEKYQYVIIKAVIKAVLKEISVTTIWKSINICNVTIDNRNLIHNT